MSSARKFFVVSGQSNNFRRTLPDAADRARRHGLDLRIVDVSALNVHWKKFPNDWRAVGLQSITDTIPDHSGLRRYVRNSVERDSLTLFLFVPDRVSRVIWRAFKRRGASIGMITPGPIPRAPSPGPAGPGSGRHGPRSAMERCKGLVKKFIKPDLDFWVVSGRQCLPIYTQFFRSVTRTRFIWAHSLEYERVLVEFGDDFEAHGTGSNSIAFLEQGWFSKPPPGFRPPATYPPVPYREYVGQLVAFFQRIESMTGSKVVICAHPKSSPEHTREMFPGFEFTFDSTNKVVAGARGVIGMSSTSVQYAVIHRKPLLLVTTPSLQQSYIQDFINGYSSELGAPQVSTDDAESLRRALKNWHVDEARYHRFMRGYVKPEPDDRRRMWEIVFAELNNGSDN